MSKYDEYWKKLPLANIARDTREFGRTSLDVSELTILGQRSIASWKSNVRFNKYRRLSGKYPWKSLKIKFKSELLV